MKIVILADAWQPLTGGGQKLFLELVERLVKDHHCQIQVITRALKHTDGKTYQNNQSLLKGKLEIIRLGPAAKWPNLLARIWFTIQSAFYALKLRPDIYLASTFLPAFSLKIIKLFKPTPQALVMIGLSGQDFFLERFITQTLKFNLTITDDIDYFKKVKSTRNIKLIFNGVDILKKSTTKKWPDFTFLFVGRNEPRKGVKILKQAFKQIKTQHPQTKLHLIGPGFKLVNQSKLHQEFLKAHCLVLPSLREGHPLVLFEAFSHKLPVIATKVGSLPKFVTKDKGYLIEVNNLTDLAKAMKQAINNKSLKTMGESGYKLVVNDFTWKKTVKNYYLALSSLLQ